MHLNNNIFLSPSRQYLCEISCQFGL